MSKKRDLNIPDPVEYILGREPQQEPQQTVQEAPQKASVTDVPAGYKVNPLFIEKRSKRLQLLIQPSLYDKLKAQADREGRSVNDLIHFLLEAGVQEAMK